MFEIVSTLLFYSNFSVDQIDRMTYFECEEYYLFYNKQEITKVDTFFKLFCFHNMESSIIANRGQKNDIQRYINSLRSPQVVNQENDLDDQFKDVNFGK